MRANLHGVGGALPVCVVRKPRSPGIGVSRTSLENGDARYVSTTTVSVVAETLRLDESERQRDGLVGLPRAAGRPAPPETLVLPTVDAIAFPAYLIDSIWQVTACKRGFPFDLALTMMTSR